MGGRIAIEMGLIAPDRIGALGLLCPAVAWIKRGLHPIVRLLRPEFGLLPHAFRRSVVASQFWSMFHDRDLIDPAVADLVVDEFLRIYHTAGARYALLASARNIYLEAPFGRHGFYRRLADLDARRRCSCGEATTASCRRRSRRHVRKWLPQAEQVTIDRLRARAAGGAPGGDQRAAARLLRRAEQLAPGDRPTDARRPDAEAA